MNFKNIHSQSQLNERAELFFTYSDHKKTVSKRVIKSERVRAFQQEKKIGNIDIDIVDYKKVYSVENQDNFILREAYPEYFKSDFRYLSVSNLYSYRILTSKINTVSILEEIVSRAYLYKASKVFFILTDLSAELLSKILESFSADYKIEKVFNDYYVFLIDLESNYHGLKLDDIVCEATEDQDLIQQYYDLREKSFKERLNIPDYSGEEDDYDRRGVIIVACIKNKVVGGARLVISTPESPIKLPLEDSTFLVKDLYPDLTLDSSSYGEITRFAVDPELMDHNVSHEISRVCVVEMINRGCKYQFSVAPILQARNSRNIARKIGVIHVIEKNIRVPHKSEHAQYEMVFSITYLLPYLYNRHINQRKTRG